VKSCKPLLFFLLLALCSSLFSEEQTQSVRIQGIGIVAEGKTLSPHFQGIQFNGVEIPGDPATFRIRLGSRFLGKPLTRDFFAKLRKEVSDYFVEQGYPAPKITVPQQDIRFGTVQIVLSSEWETEDKPAPPPPRKPTVRQEPIAVPSNENKPMMNRLCGMVLIPNQDYVHYTDLRSVQGLCVRDVIVPGGLEGLAEILEPIFMNKPITRKMIDCVKEQIVLYYRENDRPVVAVYVPEQEVTCGVLQLVVVEACVGEICCSGNSWFSGWLLQHSLPLRVGDAITADTLLTYVSWLNRNPFRNVDIVFTPGCDPGTTNIEFVICDRCPVQVYAGVDNTGNDSTGNVRYFGGVTWGNAFWLDHILNYQYTTSGDFKEFRSHTFHYTAPLFYQHLLLLYGGYSTIDPSITDFESGGSQWQGSIRYSTPYSSYCGTMQELTFGFDFKNYDTNLFFIGEEEVPITTSSINLTQFTFGISYGVEDDYGKFWANLDIYGSPGKLVPNQSSDLYSQISPGAKVKYIYGKLTMGKTWCLPLAFSFAGLARGQAASGSLLPSERFAIGGYDTVRGYTEREFSADNAFVGNAELRSPTFSLLSQFNVCNPCDEMLFLGFFDYGWGRVYNALPDIPFALLDNNPKKSDYLMSVGVGWRYFINRYFSARLDWGVKLHNSVYSDKSRSKFHGGVVLSY